MVEKNLLREEKFKRSNSFAEVLKKDQKPDEIRQEDENEEEIKLFSKES